MLRRNITHDPNGSLDSLVKYYFSKGMTYQTVVPVLGACHDIQISLRTLKCKLKTMQLTKPPNVTDSVWVTAPKKNCPPVRIKVLFRVSVRIRVRGGGFALGEIVLESLLMKLYSR